MSLWNCFKTPVEEAFASRPLIEWFTDLERGNCLLGVAGKIMEPSEGRRLLRAGGRTSSCSAGPRSSTTIFRSRWLANADSPRCIQPPVSRVHLLNEGLSPAFVDYMATGWKGFAADCSAVALDAAASQVRGAAQSGARPAPIRSMKLSA